MELMERINSDLAETMKSKEEGKELTVSVLRMIKAAVKNAEISKRGGGGGLTEEDIIGVLSSMVKQRKDSAEQYADAGRADLADKEKKEVEIIRRYLPEQLSAGDLDSLIRAAIQRTGVSSPKEMGKLMKELMPHVKGKAEGKLVNQRVKEILESMQQ
ncbi:MAG: GatB/YqeY domain-containing protein [Alphaproteobacteria bacterium]|uniref:GatB/YqeY domain-containing protein n=1 Tax=Candidatus Nitrobium versatile TaxID=2884831 RepID=A0A953JEZ1_9BACT|nr:GatB/YqeY domain-containing protein [Candidatus Nitrobium versatile]